MTFKQRVELDELQTKLNISDAELIKFMQQFSVADCSHRRTGMDAMTFDEFTDTHFTIALQQLRWLLANEREIAEGRPGAFTGLVLGIVPNGGRIHYELGDREIWKL